MSKRLVALPVAMLAIAVFAPGVANAASFNTTTTFAIASAGNAWQGKVGSPHGACIPNRTVVIQRKLAGGTTFKNVGSDKTDSTGDWSVPTVPNVDAQYRAHVTAKNVSGGTCTAKTSATLTARRTTSTIGINSAGNGFKGKIASVSACVGGRTVHLQRKSPSQTSFSNVGSVATSTSNGAWEVLTSPVNNAQYRASVNARTSGSNACLAAKSMITTAHKSTLTIAQGGSTNFHGNVISVSACEPNRTVALQRKTIYETTFHNIGSDGTSSSGFWLVPTTVVHGASYRASVVAKQNGANSCLGARSNTVVAS